MQISINYLYGAMIVLITASMLHAAVEISQFTTELMIIRKSLVVDLDLARRQFLEETNRAYVLGCKQGIEYPEEYRVSQTGFNPNSPVAWCDKQVRFLEDYFTQEAFKLGKPNH